MEGVFTSKGAVKMGAVKSFQCGNHIHKKVPAQFAQSPLPLESFLHIHTWHTEYAYALEFNVSFAGVSGIAFNVSTLCQHRWNTNANWSQSIANTDLLQMYDKRGVVEATLQALGLDIPDYPYVHLWQEKRHHASHPTSLRLNRNSHPSLQVCHSSKQMQVGPPER